MGLPFAHSPLTTLPLTNLLSTRHSPLTTLPLTKSRPYDGNMETQPTCPYCNALVPAETLQYTRIRCSRCGETFANSWTGIQSGPPHTTGNRWSEGIQSGPPKAAASTDSPRRSNRLVGIVIIGVMGLVA